MLKDKTILITGGTGSFGNAFTLHALRKLGPKRIIIFSRDEWKQSEMRKRFLDPRVEFFLGDVRSRDRLKRAFEADVDIVLHAAALKQIDTIERNPFEAVETNVIGSKNVVDAAIDSGVSRVVALSTDKACSPSSFYGATKFLLEKIVNQGNVYAGRRNTRLACVRYGNVAGSRGSVIPLFKEQAARGGPLTLTDREMTRFWISLQEAVDLVLLALGEMKGGEVFVPDIPAFRVLDLAEAIAPSLVVRIIGPRPGEKLHELLVSRDESRNCSKKTGHYLIYPSYNTWCSTRSVGEALPEGFELSSSKSRQLSVDDLRRRVADHGPGAEEP